jgi:drug/metabolite transporter (DMT)-like permease
MNIKLKMLLVTLFWGSSYVINKLVVTELPPFTIAFTRFLLVGIILSFFYCKSGNIKNDFNILKNNKIIVFYLFIICIIGIVLHNLFFYSGIQRIDGSLASLLMEVEIPLFQFIMAMIILHETLEPSKIFSFFIAVLGLIIVSYENLYRNGFAKTTVIGVILISLAAFAFTFSPIYSKKVIERISIIGSITLTTISSTIILCVFAVFEKSLYKLLSEPLSFWLEMLYLAAICTSLSIYWFNQAVKTMGPARVGAYNFLVPVWGLLLTSVFLHENISLLQIVGAIIAIVASFYITVDKKIFKVH